MRKTPAILSPLAVFLLNANGAIAQTLTAQTLPQTIAQTEALPPPEIQAAPLPSPEPPPILPAQQETIRQLVETEIQESRDISDRINDEVQDTFEWTIGLLNLLIAVLIAIPIGTGFVLWWLRQSVIDRLVSDLQRQFQDETEALVKQQLEAAVSDKLQTQIDAFEQALQQLRRDFEQRLDYLYRDAEQDKAHIVRELEQLLAAVGQDERVPPPVGRRLQELTEQLETLKSEKNGLSFSAHDYLKEGDAFYYGRRYDEAIASYQAALQLEPNLVEAWLSLAKSLRRSGQYAEAIMANEEAIRRQPENPWGWFGKGYALLGMRQYEAALQSYEAAIQAEPNHSTFWKYKGYALIKLHRYREALDHFDKALRLNPGSAETYYWKAACYAAQNQSELAIDHLKEALRRRPEFGDRLRLDPDFDSLRPLEAFQPLLLTQV